MKNEVLLGVDFGKKRVGLAISHGFMAEGIATLDYENIDNFMIEVDKIIAEQKVEKIVVGLPEHDDQAQSKWTREQAESLAEHTGLSIEYVDEAFSSVEADKYEGDRDSESARIILEQYLNS